MNLHRACHAVAVTAALVAPAPVHAQGITPITLASGRSTTLETPGLTRVAVGDATIAGVVPVGTSQVIVNAKRSGHTTLIVWYAGVRREYDLTVTEQTLDDLAQLLRTSLDEGGVNVDAIGRSIVVRGAVADQVRRNRVADIVKRFGDVAKANRYEIVDAVTVANPLGAMRDALARTVGANDVRVDYDGSGNVIVSGDVRDRASAEAVLQRVRSLAGATLGVNGKMVDRLVLAQNEQVQTKVSILEVDRTGLQQLGIRLQGAEVDPTGQVRYLDPAFPIYENPGALAVPGRGTTLGAFIRSRFLAPTLDLLERTGHARILSQPDLLTMPGAEATFLVGGEIPYIVPSGLGQVSVVFKEYGVRLKVTPRILPDGSVESRINPEVSDLNYQNGITVAGYTVPSITTSRIDTDVVTKSGESIVMAGLLRRQETRNIDKIPGLGDLPILGKLFRSTRYQTAQTDVVFVMTPEVITR